MKDKLNQNSVWVQRFAMLTNLIMLNVLWLVCCIPAFTAGAATTAMYHTIFQYHTQQDDAVLRPFFRAFRANFKQATILWLIILLIEGLLVFDIVYLISHGEEIGILFVLIVVMTLVAGIQAHLFPMIARFDMTTKALLRSAASLMVLHLPTTLLVLVMNLVPLLVYVYDPMLFLRTGILWLGVWFALVAYLNGKMQLKIWSKHMPPNNEESVA